MIINNIINNNNNVNKHYVNKNQFTADLWE